MKTMKIIKLCLLFALLIPQTAFGEDIYYKVIETTPIWAGDTIIHRRNNTSGNILEGTIVKEYGENVIFFSREGLVDIPFQAVFYDNRRIILYANSLIPLETQDVFDSILLYNPERPLFSSFYAEALWAKDRQIIYLHNKAEWDELVAWRNKDLEYEYEWWRHAYTYENLYITQTAINFKPNERKESRLSIKKIVKVEERYEVTVKETTNKGLFFNWEWKDLAEGELFTILLIPDGDYIDLYYKDTNTLIDTFVFTSVEFKTQLENLIQGRSVDLSRITWPRRADGSMDYPPPSPAVTQEIQQPVDTNETVVSGIDATTENQNNANKNPLPLWAWFAIGGAVAAGGAVFVIKRKK
jgi:hypothetical protein